MHKHTDLDPLTAEDEQVRSEQEQLDDWAEKQHRDLLESYVKRIWDATKLLGRGQTNRTLEHRLEIVARHMHNVSRYGVKNNDETDYQFDLLLTEWGAGKLIAYFGALAETESK